MGRLSHSCAGSNPGRRTASSPVRAISPVLGIVLGVHEVESLRTCAVRFKLHRASCHLVMGHVGALEEETARRIVFKLRLVEGAAFSKPQCPADDGDERVIGMRMR